MVVKKWWSIVVRPINNHLKQTQEHVGKVQKILCWNIEFTLRDQTNVTGWKRDPEWRWWFPVENGDFYCHYLVYQRVDILGSVINKPPLPPKRTRLEPVEVMKVLFPSHLERFLSTKSRFDKKPEHFGKGKGEQRWLTNKEAPKMRSWKCKRDVYILWKHMLGSAKTLVHSR